MVRQLLYKLLNCVRAIFQTPWDDSQTYNVDVCQKFLPHVGVTLNIMLSIAAKFRFEIVYYIVCTMSGFRSWKFRLSFYPHRLEDFNALLRSVFGDDVEHEIYADFEPLDKCDRVPAYYMHVIKRKA